LGFSLITLLLGILFVLVSLVALSWKCFGEDIGRLYIPDEDEVQGQGAGFLKELPVHSFEQAQKKSSILDGDKKKRR
jgi:hypothetical protein